MCYRCTVGSIVGYGYTSWFVFSISQIISATPKADASSHLATCNVLQEWILGYLAEYLLTSECSTARRATETFCNLSDDIVRL